MAASLLAATFSALVANANPITVVVACPGGNPANGVTVNINDCDGTPIGTGVTGDGGVPGTTVITIGIGACAPCAITPGVNCWPFNISVCVDVTTLPQGASLADGNDNNCKPVVVPSIDGTSATFDLTGSFCTPPVATACWETGGGTIASDGKGEKQQPPYWTYGGNIYPGCGPNAGSGGSLNIKNHVTGLHFHGTDFVVDDCRGVSTKSPKVKVNIIDWHGTGYVSGDDLSNKTPVTFFGTFRDAHESGAGADGLFIQVTGPDGSIMTDFAIGSPPTVSGGVITDHLFLISTGNVQIHQSSCP
jgi:hypothetical protein